MNNPFDIPFQPIQIGPVIAQAVFSGHLAAREFDESINQDETPFRVERVKI